MLNLPLKSNVNPGLHGEAEVDELRAPPGQSACYERYASERERRQHKRRTETF